MAASLMDRLGFGNDRAVSNARRAALRREADDQLIAELVEGMARPVRAGRAS